MKRTAILGALAVFAALAAVMPTTAGAAPVQKETLCHVTDEGSVLTLRLPTRAIENRIANGENDGRPGDAVSTMDGFVFGDDCVPVEVEPSKFCATLDGYQVSPTNTGSTAFRIAFTNSPLFAEETVSVTVTNSDTSAHAFEVTISNELYVTPATTFKAGSTSLIDPNTSETIALDNLNDPAGNTRFILRLERTEGTSPDLANVTFLFACS